MRLPSIVLAAVLLAAGLSGCSASSGRCIDYIGLDSPQQRFDAAEVLVLADVHDTGRTIDSFAQYPAYRATTVRVLKGRAPASFDLIAPSDQCEQQGRPAEYLEGDPLAHFDRGLLYLVRGDYAWQLTTPGSLDHVPAGEPLPHLTTTPSTSPRPR